PVPARLGREAASRLPGAAPLGAGPGSGGAAAQSHRSRLSGARRGALARPPRRLTVDLRMSVMTVAAMGGGGWLFWQGMRGFQIARLIENTPSGRIRSMGMG